MVDSSNESLNIDWTSDEDECEIETVSTVHQDPVVDVGMDDSSSESLNIDWTSEDEGEIETASTVHKGKIVDSGSSSSSSPLPGSKAMDEFLNMGFSVDMVEKALKEYGSNDKEAILDALLTYSITENSPDDDFSVHVLSSDEEKDPISSLEIYEKKGTSNLNAKDSIVSTLVEMGYTADFASAAVDRCGIDTPIIELIDMMAAASMVNDNETETPVGENFRRKEMCCTSNQKRKLHVVEKLTIKRHRVISNEGRSLEKQPMIHNDDDDNDDDDNDDDDLRFRIPTPMVGFGLPNHRPLVTDRKIPVVAQGRPYFYYENVALTPKGVWSKISSFLYGIMPEFVDSKYFSAACRKRGYIHNLPIKNRFQVLPVPPTTIHEALPQTKEHWPSWDTRTQLNCILTCLASAKLTDRVKARVDKPGGPSAADKDYVLKQCKKWNMVWVGKHKVAPLEPDEIERIMGFPPNHTRGGGVTHTDRFTVLGNTFQVDTVAYHLSVLKNMFPNGLNVLSLFTGIGGAEVALHRIGIRHMNVVSVEKSDTCRKILQDWWDQTNQPGKLVHFNDIERVSADHLQAWISEFGGFDLIIGGSPCNNLAGGNRATRTGLEGKHSSLFYEYHRIIDTVRRLMKS